jgi:hypothetical protein
MTGSKMDRPQLTAALEYLRQRDTLGLWKMDRAGRNTRGVLELVENLTRRDIGLKSITEEIDTSGPMGKAILTVMPAFGTLERDAIDARNLMVEYGQTTSQGGHVHRPPRGHSLQTGETVRRHICCWFQESSGSTGERPGRTGTGYPGSYWVAVYITDLRLLIRLPGQAQLSRGPMVSVWWDDEPRFHGDLRAGYLDVNDQGPGISLSGTQVAVLAVACVSTSTVRKVLPGTLRYKRVARLRPCQS